jgi:tetratricopeptide (TPR) repeat protein
MGNAWDLIKAGEFDQACAAADEEHHRSGSFLPLRNKVLALLNLNQHAQAVALSQNIIERNNGDTDGDFIFLGVAHWLQGQNAQAIEAWRRATRTDYTDAAGGVEAPLLLLYAGVRTGLPALQEEAMRILDALLPAPAIKNWPGPIARHMSRHLTESGLRETISSQPVLNAKQTCQAAFHAGVMHLLDANLSVFQERMLEAAGQGPFSLTKQEYYLARGEIESEIRPVTIG